MIEDFGGIGVLAGVVAYGIVVALFAAGIAFWMGTSEKARSARSRATIGAATASAILCLVPVAALLLTEPLMPETLLVFVVMMVAAVFLAAVFGFPSAFWVSRRYDAKHQRNGELAE